MELFMGVGRMFERMCLYGNILFCLVRLKMRSDLDNVWDIVFDSIRVQFKADNNSVDSSGTRISILNSAIQRVCGNSFILPMINFQFCLVRFKVEERNPIDGQLQGFNSIIK